MSGTESIEFVAGEATILGIKSMPISELSPSLLLRAGGAEMFQKAKALVVAGAVLSADLSPPVLRARVREKGRVLPVLLKISEAGQIQAQCLCADATRRGILCAHAIAAGLFFLNNGSSDGRETKPALLASNAPECKTEKDSQEDSLTHFTLEIEGSANALVARVHYAPNDGKTPPRAAIQAFHEKLKAQGFVARGEEFLLSGSREVMHFYAAHLPEWKKSANVELGPRFAKVTKNWLVLEPAPFLAKHDGWLDFRMHFRAGSEAVFDAQELRRLLAGGIGAVRLKSGRLAIVNPSTLEDAEEVLRDIDPMREGKGWRVHPHHEGYLRLCIADWTGGSSQELAESISAPALSNILRPYQLEGAQWLLRLALNKTGGLLADEMGLGKTVQTLAALGVLPGPHLIVCPTSLVWNWHSEIQRFLPGRTVLLLLGAGREELYDQIPQADFVLTSYALLQRDIDRLREISFGCVVLDEAQHIKNPESLNARAARCLRASARFVLTGTPLENSLRDLWSLFHFLLPGYLGDRKDFRDRYEIPLQSAGPTSPLWKRLRMRLAPFFLRRIKADVLSDLPEKMEQTVLVELGERERSAYDALQAAARAQLDKLTGTGNDAPARMLLLTALLRLRQACCDIRLLRGTDALSTPVAEEPSAKLAALMELLQEVVDGGHRALVFSQFASLLDLCEPLLRKSGIAFLRLDGTTKNRADVVAQFQHENGPPVFLLSLKAGGAGLNLTAADTVILLDPWWNPAVEAQAIGRAHRIGQRRMITTIRLVARDTVEERVLAMQSAKLELFEQAVRAFEGAKPPSFSPEDLAALRKLL